MAHPAVHDSAVGSSPNPPFSMGLYAAILLGYCRASVNIVYIPYGGLR
jgi:hypothetical protein